LVEDDEAVRLMIEHVLLHEGHEVHATGTMTDAMNLIRCGRYDLVISDVKLPDGTGIDVADAATDKDIKTIVISGYAFSLPREVADRYEILLKPLRPIEIVAAVEQSLQD